MTKAAFCHSPHLYSVLFLILDAVKRRESLQEDNTIYNERSLLQQIAEGSEDAFRQVFNHYRRRVYSYLLKITRSETISEDLLQEVFLELWSIRQRLPAIEYFNAYLHRIAHSKAVRGLQLVAREHLVKIKLREEEQGSVDAGSRLLSEETRLVIQKLVDHLSPMQRKVFLLSREEELTANEIAGNLGLTPNTVRKHLRDAVQFLREELGRHYGANAVAIFVIYQIS